MPFKLRTAMLVLAATLATTAALASAAQAGQFTAASYPATITGTATEKHTFGFEAGTVICKVASFDSTLSAAAESLTVSAEYQECATPGGNVVTVDMDGCDYEFTAGETLAQERVDGFLAVKCAESGDEITFTEPANGCVVKIPSQTQSTLIYKNHKVEKDFEVNIGLAEVQYTQNANCAGGAGKFNNGTYTGKDTMKADEEIGTMVD